MLTPDDMHPFQREGAQDLYDNPRRLLLADMGVGKTVIAGTAIKNLSDAWRISHTLIVAPKTVALSTWPEELQTWSHLKDLSYHVLDGHHTQLKHDVENVYTDITIIGTHRFRWLWENYWQKGRRFWRWDCIILDESSKVKNNGTNVFRAFKSLHRHVPYFYALTAKPIPNGYLDLWAQAYLIDSGERFYATKEDYIINHFNHNIYTRTYEPRADDTIDNILSELSEISCRIDAMDHLPPLSSRVVDVKLHLDDIETKRYEEMEEEQLLVFEETEVEVFNAATLCNKLRQMANGSVYVDKEGRWVKEHDRKLDALDDIIASAQGRPIIIAYEFKSDLERLKRKYGKRLTVFDSKKANEMVKGWNAGRYKLLAANPASFSHGLNMQKGGHIIVFYTVPWNLDSYEQAIGRILRQGQESLVTIYRLIIMRTIDEAVVDRIGVKAERQTSALATIKQYITQKTGKVFPSRAQSPDPPEPESTEYNPLSDWPE